MNFAGGGFNKLNSALEKAAAPGRHREEIDMKTAWIITYKSEGITLSLELIGDARRDMSHIEVRSHYHRGNTKDMRVVCTPEAIRKLRKALQVREGELVNRGFLEAE